MFRFPKFIKNIIPFKIYNSNLGLNLKRNIHAECLNYRSLVKVQGHETKEFLQGIITNDIEHLEETHVSSIYTMFLNVQGRVLFDGFLLKQENDYIIDCDTQVLDAVVNHLKLHKVRRKVTFQKLDESHKIWVLYDNDIDLSTLSSDIKNMYYQPKNKASFYFKNIEDLPSEAIVTKDPRLIYLGDRIIFPAHKSLLDYSDIYQVEKGGFQRFRYKLGIGEGVEDLSRGKSLPLESNCDYLHGVSFQKGCYIGQELTARTYHTGIVRKRIMPLSFDEDIEHKIEKYATISNEKGKKVGKLINISGKYGIGLLRIKESLNAHKLCIGEVGIKISKPGWWPLEASKDRQDTSDI